MTTQLSVYADPQAEAAGAVSAVVASLPLSFGPAPDGPAVSAPDVTAVAGHAGWTGRSADAIRNGAKGVVVSGPVAEDPAELIAVADGAGSVVVLDQQWAGNTALAPAAGNVHSVIAVADGAGSVVVLDQQWAGNTALAPAAGNVHSVIATALQDAVLLDSVAVAAPGTDPVHLLTDQLAVLVQCGITVRNVRMVQQNGNGYTVAGVLAGGVPVALQGILTSALPATASLTILTSAGRADVVLPDPAAAWPAKVRAVTAEGATTLPTLYESSHRTSWSRAHSHISSGIPANDLTQFTSVMSLLSQLTS
ncbi:hypothetical protein [Arthrobacter sp. B10-11]|uniref:hypothetical protein n=1 Tax=Arthrobacter sp. B10-11 TaxID=3081160 RepID=UPI002953F9A8|nr:hypothetical protein [Arthrobacter sp. B10-11]MDV8147322.1 hypothetical protein [Arthrobacter sp. B10-11]